jgi:hypothetical protein
MCPLGYLTGTAAQFEIDTGLCVTILNELKTALLRRGKLCTYLHCGQTLRSYSCDNLQVSGTITVLTRYQAKWRNSKVFVVKDYGSNLVGRQWLKTLNMALPCINNIQTDDVSHTLKDLHKTF